jgi:hypothetical protein
MSGERLDLSDALRPDYPQPRCEICGRFAGRGFGGVWRFACTFWTGETWEHE